VTGPHSRKMIALKTLRQFQLERFVDLYDIQNCAISYREKILVLFCQKFCRSYAQAPTHPGVGACKDAGYTGQ
jgi:hypothetical protein